VGSLWVNFNRELGGSCDPMAFRHVAEYSEETGLAKSFIQSIKRQKVEIKNLDMTILFEEGEKVFFWKFHASMMTISSKQLHLILH
jgi:L-histidine N-alpha-methyltransferase